ncbi:MAG: hypothetical protein U5L01_02140 [Rheinheimera sp.]|nr:hypothetical protein [Rheinheimera sp.]
MVHLTLLKSGDFRRSKLKSTVLEETLLADLVTDLPAAVRYERLVITLQSHFGCQAVGSVAA